MTLGELLAVLLPMGLNASGLVYGSVVWDITRQLGGPAISKLFVSNQFRQFSCASDGKGKLKW